MKRMLKNQSGAVLITFAILLVVLLGFVALATEAGRWYLVRSELSKAVDAAALAGAQNISNPFVTPVDTIVQQVGDENFPAGQFGTIGTGQGSVSFTTIHPQSNEIQVSGSVTAIAILAQLFGIGQVPVSSSGVAQKNKVEIMMVLDRSGSMAGTPIANLKTAATSFLSFFQETQDQDKLGLISFATGVTVDQQLTTNSVNTMTAKISAMSAIGATNAEDAIAQAGGPQSFTDQTHVPGDQRIKQYLIFFTDGHPTAFRGRFTSNGIPYDAVVMGTGNYCDSVYAYIGHTDSESFYPLSTISATTTGDGNAISSTSCTCPGGSYQYDPYYGCVYCSGQHYLNTRWYILEDPKYGLAASGFPGYNPVQCRHAYYYYDYYYCGGNYGDYLFFYNVLAPYICNTAKNMAIDHAQALKDKGIKIYTIGLEGNGGVDHGFLGQVASGSTYEYYAPTSADLEGIFNAIAREIKLRLVG